MNNTSKVAIDMFFQHFKWTIGFFMFLFIAHVVKIGFAYYNDDFTSDFLLFSNVSSRIYMLVIGIISAYGFLTFYVNHGITRKDYFRGSAIASLGLAFVIALIIIIITSIEFFIIDTFHLPAVLENAATSTVDISGDPIMTQILVLLLDPTYVLTGKGWLMAFVVSGITMFIFYLIGWLIGVGYYRYGWIIGFSFIAIAIISACTLTLFWAEGLDDHLSNWLPFASINLPFYGSIIGSVILASILLWLIRFITKNVTIKM